MNLEELMASTPPMQQHALIKGFQAGAASRDADIQHLKMALADAEALELGTAEKCDQLRAELAAALAACKLKDGALTSLTIHRELAASGEYEAAEETLAIQPDDAALKAWLGEPVAYCNIAEDGYVMLTANKISGWKPLYSPKGLK